MQITRAAKGYLYFIILLLGILLAQLVWKVVAIASPTPTSHVFNLTDEHRTNTTINSSDDLSAIVNAQIFGSATAQKKAIIKKVASASSLKKTKLNLRLNGLIKGKHSVAVIIYKGQQRPYSPGEYIVNTARLKVQLDAVYHNYVTILNNGVEERLNLPKITRQSNVLSGITAAPASTLATNSAAPRLSVDLNSAPLRALIGANPRRVITTNPLSLSKFLHISPSISKGKLNGYKISSGPDKRILAAAGISTGDIVTHVDGAAVAGLTIPSMYKILQEKSSFRVTINRDGAVITFDIQL